VWITLNYVVPKAVHRRYIDHVATFTKEGWRYTGTAEDARFIPVSCSSYWHYAGRESFTLAFLAVWRPLGHIRKNASRNVAAGGEPRRSHHPQNIAVQS